MHEGHFTEQIVEAVLKELNGVPVDPSTAIRVSVGETFHLVPESVQLHYGILTQGTPLEGTVLMLEEIPVQVECRRCGERGGVEDHHLLLCSRCGSQDVTMVAGHEVTVEVSAS